MSSRPKQDTARVIALAVAFFGGLAALGLANGVFARIGTEETLMLAAFGLAFAMLTWHLDADVRAYVKRLLRPRATLTKPQGDRPAAI